MKKTLMSLLLVSLSLTMFFGCAEEKKNETPNTPVNPADINTFKGTYDVQAFYTSAVVANFTNDCVKIKSIVSDATCDPTKNVNLAAKAVINGANEDSMVLETKVQMWGGSFAEAVLMPGLGDIVKNNSYNYTRYNPIIKNGDIFTSTGTYGRNFKSEEMNIANSDTNMTIQPDGTILVKMSMQMVIPGISSEVTVPTYVLLRKINNYTPSLNPNTLVKADVAGFEGFVPGFINSASKGDYTVGMFYTNAMNFELTNNCVKAKELIGSSVTCDTTNDVKSATQARLVGDDASGYYFETKVQLWGGLLDALVSMLPEMIKPNYYNYTKYSVAINDLNDASTSFGVSGRNFLNLTNDSGAIANATLKDDGSILIHLEMVAILNNGSAEEPTFVEVPTTTYVQLIKANDTPSAMNPNTLVDPNAEGFNPELATEFQANPGPVLVPTPAP